MKKRLERIIYSPGYCDMRGAFHQIVVKKNSEGKWIYESADKEEFSSPTKTVSQEIDRDKVEDLEAFIIKERIAGLTLRPKSSMFATDNSPWRIEITMTDEKENNKWYSLDEYKVYLPSDLRKIENLKEKIKRILEK